MSCYISLSLTHVHTANWESHPDVGEMIELQQRGLSIGQETAATSGAAAAESRRMEESTEKQTQNKFAMLLKMEDSDS